MEAAGADRVIRHPAPLGCHPSALEGFRLSTGKWVVFLPADGQIPPAVVPDHLAHLPICRREDPCCLADVLHRIARRRVPLRAPAVEAPASARLPSPLSPRASSLRVEIPT